MVCCFFHFLTLNLTFYWAFHSWISESGYSWTSVSWPSSPDHQRYLQGSPCHLGHWIYWGDLFTGRGKTSFSWHQLPVSYHLLSFSNHPLPSHKLRIAAAPLVPGLRCFPEGRGFKQWTGDDSKALMKVWCHLLCLLCYDLFPWQVYLPAIVGHVPPQMVHAISAFMEFCYLVCCSVIDDNNLIALDNAMADFHCERIAFNAIHSDGYSLPRQHSIVHYKFLIQDFSAPNGLCSSITESRHISAVKEPWHRLSRFEVLRQMLVTNQWLDKLVAAQVKFQARGMLNASIFSGHDLPGTQLPPTTWPEVDEDDDGGAVDGDILGEVTLTRKPCTSDQHG